MADGLIDIPGEFSVQLRARTADLHVRAERSGIIRELLKGQSTIAGYISLQRCLLPVYEALEAALAGQPDNSPLRAIVRPELYRATALKADIARISTLRGIVSMALPPAAVAYAERITTVRHDGRLIAHAYVRYLGDLSGGQVLRRRLSQLFKLDVDCLTFYDFPDITDVMVFKESYRRSLDLIAQSFGDFEPILAEAEEAFRLNIAVSEAVAALAGSN